MHWKRKAAVQNLVAKLPDWLSTSVYYRLQRQFGALRRIDPTSRLRAGIQTWDHIVASGRNPIGSTFFEVGTGRMLNVPIAYWLLGAERTITVDLNRYLKLPLIHCSLRYIRDHADQIRELFGDRLVASRFEQLLEAARGRLALEQVLDLLGVEYYAPANASRTGLPPGSIDFHTSYTVFEHIPHPELLAILREAQRITRPNGLAVHFIDYSDHFSHVDRSINAINFLQFDQKQWDRLAGNRYMYMNRLRHHDYLSLFEQAECEVLSQQPSIEGHLLSQLLADRIPLDEAFRSASQQDLATTSAWIVAQPHAALAKCG